MPGDPWRRVLCVLRVGAELLGATTRALRAPRVFTQN